MKGDSTDVFWRISEDGAITVLQQLPQKKDSFGMAYSSGARTLYSVRGSTCQPRLHKYGELDEVTSYSIKLNKWSQLAPFPDEIADSSVCVLREKWLYNLGGRGSSWSVGRLGLSGGGRAGRGRKWEEVLLQEGLSFYFWTGYGVHVMDGLIIMFGSSDDNATFILREE